jgi:hypothetical protein
MNTLAIKILLMPIVIAIVSHAIKKWGPTMAGIISCLPWVAGPILIFIAVEQGSIFAAHTIPGVMVGILGWLAFCVTYAYLGRKYNPIWCCISGYLAYLLTALVFKDIPGFIGLNLSFALAILLISIAFYYFPHLKKPYTKPLKEFRYDLLMRMIASTLIVVSITQLAEMLGPKWSGILTPIPVITAVVAVFTHYTQGMEATISLFKGLLMGVYGFTIFLFSQAYLLPKTSILFSFMIGIFFNILMTILVRWILIKIHFIQR